MNLTLVQRTGSEPITLQEAKDHCYVTSVDIDVEATLTDAIAEAREYCQGHTWQIIVAGIYEYRIDSFPNGREILEIDKYPIVSVDSVEYIDTDGNIQIINNSNYVADTYSYTTRIKPEEDWPTVKDQPFAITVSLTAGYDDSSPRFECPGNIKRAVKLLVGHYFNNREVVVVSEGRSVDAKEVPMTVKALLDMESLRIFV